MRIVLMLEGKTENVFLQHVRTFVNDRIQGPKQRIVGRPYHGLIPTGAELRRRVNLLLNDRRDPAEHVVALTDVYTGTNPPDFIDADDAKAKMRAWVGNETRFIAHAAQHEFEAWLLPFWKDIQRIAGYNRSAPGSSPEHVNHGKPPSHHLEEIFRIGKPSRKYVKSRDARRILDGKDLAIPAQACPELKAFLNTLLTLGGAAEIP